MKKSSTTAGVDRRDFGLPFHVLGFLNVRRFFVKLVLTLCSAGVRASALRTFSTASAKSLDLLAADIRCQARFVRRDRRVSAASGNKHASCGLSVSGVAAAAYTGVNISGSIRVDCILFVFFNSVNQY